MTEDTPKYQVGRIEQLTPRTDAALERYRECMPMGSGEFSPVALCRELEKENAKLRRLARFGLLLLEESRRELADLDGGWIQDKAQELGLLMSVPVAEPCGENCHCAEYGDFPQDCLRYSEDVKRIAEILADTP